MCKWNWMTHSKITVCLKNIPPKSKKNKSTAGNNDPLEIANLSVKRTTREYVNNISTRWEVENKGIIIIIITIILWYNQAIFRDVILHMLTLNLYMY